MNTVLNATRVEKTSIKRAEGGGRVAHFLTRTYVIMMVLKTLEPMHVFVDSSFSSNTLAALAFSNRLIGSQKIDDTNSSRSQ